MKYRANKNKGKINLDNIFIGSIFVILALLVVLSSSLDAKKEKELRNERKIDVINNAGQKLKTLEESELKKWFSENQNIEVLNLCYNERGREYIIIYREIRQELRGEK